MFRIIFSLFTLTVLFFPDSLLASVIDVEMDKENYFIGDRIRLRVEVDGEGYSLIEPGKGKVKPFELDTIEEQYDEALKKTLFVVRGRIFEVGEFSIPPFVIEAADGEKLETASTTITVVPTLKGDEEDIRDLKPQVEVSEGLSPLVLILFLAAILLVVGALFYFLRRKKMAEPEIVEQKVPPHEIALQKIKEIEGLGLIREGRIKEFYTLISDVVRVFKGEVYGLDALEMTTSELVEFLRKKGGRAVRDIEHFLNDCDRVKFAKYSPPDIDVEGLADRAVRIIEMEIPFLVDNEKVEGVDEKGNPCEVRPSGGEQDASL